MQQYVLRRLMFSIPALLVVTVFAFILIRLAPGDIVDARLAESGGVTEEQREAMRHQLGLDRNPVEQYFRWLGGILSGDLGTSLVNDRPIWDQIKRRAPLTLEMAGLALLCSFIIAIPVGVLSAIRPNSILDQGLRVFSVLGLSLPDFWIATLVVVFLAREFHWLPPPYTSLREDPVGNLTTLLFPVLIVGYRLSAISARMTRSAMLEVLNQDYVRTARAKGLRERVVVIQHGLKNALIPVLSVVGNQVIYLVGGLVLMEFVFNLPGMGTMTYEAVRMRDYTVLQANLLIFAVMIILSNIAVDLLYGVLDPRIKYS